jgi:cytochrome b
VNVAFASPAEPQQPPAAERRILVWDAPVRLFHWLMVLSFAGAWLTAESERWRLLHVTLGYTMAGLVVFRLLWGLIGTRHARFATFVRGPAAARRYLRSLFGGEPEHHAGHNPAGALAIVALLVLALGVTFTGWAHFNGVFGGWTEDAHEAVANAMLALVGLHVAAVVLASRLHRENLVAAMISGHKRGAPQDAIRRAWTSVAMLMAVAVLGFWWLQWQAAPAGGAIAERPHAAARAGHHGDHDDD